MEKPNYKALAKELDLLMKGIDDHQKELSAYADKVIGILVPRHLGGHGNNTSLNRLYAALLEKRLDNWAYSLKAYVQDNFGTVIEFKDSQFRLTKGNKEIRELPKGNGANVLAYVRILSEEDKKNAQERAQKSKETREANKKLAEDNAKSVVTLKQENDTLRQKVQELKHAPKGKKEKELSDRVEKQIEIIKEKDSSLSVANEELSELKEKVTKLEGQINLLEQALQNRNKEIQRLQGMLDAEGIIHTLKEKVRELEAA